MTSRFLPFAAMRPGANREDFQALNTIYWRSQISSQVDDCLSSDEANHLYFTMYRVCIAAGGHFAHTASPHVLGKQAFENPMTPAHLKKQAVIQLAYEKQLTDEHDAEFEILFNSAIQAKGALDRKV